MISSLAAKCQHFKLRGLEFHNIKWLKKEHFNFKVLAFWSQWRYHYQIQITRPLYHKIKYWNASGSGFPPSLIPALWNIGILYHKKAKLRKHMRQSVCGFMHNFHKKSWMLSRYLLSTQLHWASKDYVQSILLHFYKYTL